MRGNGLLGGEGGTGDDARDRSASVGETRFKASIFPASLSRFLVRACFLDSPRGCYRSVKSHVEDLRFNQVNCISGRTDRIRTFREYHMVAVFSLCSLLRKYNSRRQRRIHSNEFEGKLANYLV